MKVNSAILRSNNTRDLRDEFAILRMRISALGIAVPQGNAAWPRSEWESHLRRVRSLYETVKRGTK